MALEPFSFLDFPNEIICKILLLSFDESRDRFVLKTTDLVNACKLSNKIEIILHGERCAFLFDAVFEFLKDKIPEADLFKCRRVCQRWKRTLDKHLTLQRFIGENKRFNPYEVLGVDIRASTTEVKRAALDKIRLSHPDKGGSHIKSVNILLAKKILTNRIYRTYFRDCHKSPLHLKAAWEIYERAVANDEQVDADV